MYEQDLCMLEQLNYLGPEIARKAGVSGFDGIESYPTSTIGEVLQSFDTSKLRNDGNNVNGSATNIEWANIIDYIKGNSELSKLKLVDTLNKKNDGACVGLCYVDESAGKAYVAFNGTTGKDEWVDDVEGLNRADTNSQLEALNFIESLPYDDITVTGHSKGGNKAMYVAITSDKVTNCVSFDGEGFSQEFIEKYWAEIQLRGKNITSCSVSTDYVHSLLFPIPNANLKYYRGYKNGDRLDDRMFDKEKVTRHHYANSFFVTDNEGNIFYDLETGLPKMVETAEDPSITMLHEFTTFVINNGNSEDKAIIVSYVSKLLSVAMTKELKNDEIIDYILSDTDALVLIIAYLAKYMAENDLDAEDIDSLLKMLGLDTLNELIELGEFDIPLLKQKIGVNLNLANIINCIKEQLNDDDDDWFIKNLLLPFLKCLFAKDVNVNISEVWERINSKIKEIDASKGKGNAKIKKGKIRDFSVSNYNVLMDSIKKIDSSTVSVSSWNGYSGEEWFSSLFISLAIKGINLYFSNINGINSQCKHKISKLFEDVSKADSKCGKLINADNLNLKDAYEKIISVASEV